MRIQMECEIKENMINLLVPSNICIFVNIHAYVVVSVFSRLFIHVLISACLGINAVGSRWENGL